ncbi:hypothetical protein [Klebsiella aerogenes]|uniref:hypothetical protein n=1 Tax=Klebsiella aerogenes TaxID=548 RepID=UPI0012F62F87|nr:hypothetical protein [Klebsiella aerogenes]
MKTSIINGSEVSRLSVAIQDVEELEVAIKTDGPIAGKKAQYGSAVGTWLANVISKAANTSIGISVAAATEVATKALKRYYGFD